VFEKRMLNRLFGPKRNGMTRRWNKLHNKELHDLYSSPSINRIIKSRKMRCTEHVARIRRRNVYRVLLGKPKEKRPLGTPRIRWIDSIGWCRLDWSSSGQAHVESSCERGTEPSGSQKMLGNIKWLQN
jgi:hypothetical protein